MTPPVNGVSYSYDLSIGGQDTFDASLATVYPSGCGWTLQSLSVVEYWTGEEETRIDYLPG